LPLGRIACPHSGCPTHQPTAQPQLARHRLTAQPNGKLLRRLTEAANQSSIQERNAEDAEREATDIKMTQYMADHIGEEFDGVISGTTNFGFFVELENTVNGLVHVSSLDDDYYEYHENSRTLMGKRKGVCYRLGDAVRIIVVRVQPEERLIDFELAEDTGADSDNE
ncbi:MAG: S1 RNA-binding domain-containing protein, partial [Bacillota bacterium]|nr:S1 RNA-binding domain-containing protein [Bacillota bacterium]